MEFNDNKPIYRQIVDHAFALILEMKWLPGERIPSVRELSAELGVNTRTVLKALDELQSAALIEPKRGMGFLLARDARVKVEQELRKEFFSSTVPSLVEEMKRLSISAADLLPYLPE
ncbi:MAG: GntR family transcriptional regulator [Muribaculaceae bacterium]|nr:GntR family transcriptional regulator [Bacteroides sp.]MDE6227269.1 GntR family transcriptional regulator [Muribaculaceae bacterium]